MGGRPKFASLGKEGGGLRGKPGLNKDHCSFCKPSPPRAGREGCLGAPEPRLSFSHPEFPIPGPLFMLQEISAVWEAGVEGAFLGVEVSKSGCWKGCYRPGVPGTAAAPVSAPERGQANGVCVCVCVCVCVRTTRLLHCGCCSYHLGLLCGQGEPACPDGSREHPFPP